MIDEQQLETIAGELGVPYLHCTDPEAPIEGTMDSITLRPVPIESTRAWRARRLVLARLDPARRPADLGAGR